MSEEKKLTDEEIVKALEHCATENTCRGCVKHNGEPTIDYFKCIRDTRKKVVDLIHRLQSENERLTEENGQLKGYNSGLEYEIELLTEEIDQRREMMNRMNCNYATELQKNAELQKQVDELKEENKELYKENTTLIAGSILERKDIAKDTAKEIYCHIAKAYYDKEMLKIFREYLKERYGVEVE